MVHRQGPKIAGKHTTVTDAAVVVVDTAIADALVTKVILSTIKAGCGNGHGNRRLKIQDTEAGLRVMVRGSASVQELVVMTSPENRHAVAGRLKEAFDRR